MVKIGWNQKMQNKRPSKNDVYLGTAIFGHLFFGPFLEIPQRAKC